MGHLRYLLWCGYLMVWCAVIGIATVQLMSSMCPACFLLAYTCIRRKFLWTTVSGRWFCNGPSYNSSCFDIGRVFKARLGVLEWGVLKNQIRVPRQVVLS